MKVPEEYPLKNINDIRKLCETAAEHAELDEAIVDWILRKQLEDLVYKETYGDQFTELIYPKNE
jgi:hypothetical protein